MGKTNDRSALDALRLALAALAPRLEPGEAVRDASAAARQAVEAMGKIPPDAALEALSRALAALAVQSGLGEPFQRTPLLAVAVGNSTSSQTALAGLAPLLEASRPSPGRFTEQQLVDLLKMPTCWQPARQVIVRQLGWQCGQTFANQWEFVEWARQHRPDLDILSPPQLPQP